MEDQTTYEEYPHYKPDAAMERLTTSMDNDISSYFIGNPTVQHI